MGGCQHLETNDYEADVKLNTCRCDACDVLSLDPWGHDVRMVMAVRTLLFPVPLSPIQTSFAI